MAKGLTEKQRKILEYIIDFQKENGFPPTIRELGDAFQIGSLRGVTVHLDALVRKGCMTRERTSRSIRITMPDPRDVERSGSAATGSSSFRAGRSEPSVRLPLVRRPGGGIGGTLTSIGNEKLSIDGEVERYVALPEEVAGPASENGFVIRVGATGVYGEPIVPGDLLVVRPQRTAAAGELVVTLFHGDLTVCRATPNAEGVPGSSETSVETVGQESILGRVVALVRRY